MKKPLVNGEGWDVAWLSCLCSHIRLGTRTVGINLAQEQDQTDQVWGYINQTYRHTNDCPQPNGWEH